MRSEWKQIAILAGLCSVVALSGCRVGASGDELNDELAQAAGDALEGLDEMTFSSGVRNSNEGFQGSRVACVDVPFSSCTNNVKTRTFGGCTLGSLTFAGTTTLTWDDTLVDNTCAVDAEGHSVSRKPNWTVTGSRGWTIAVSTPGTFGQKVTWQTDTAATFTSDGIRRTATTAGGDVIADFTTKTTTGLSITFDGSEPRGGRVVDGGAIEIKNNLTDSTCNVTPDEVTWTDTCTCPVSGTVAGSCSDSTSYALTFNGCGTGSITAGGTTTSVTLGRCATVTPAP